MATDLWPEIRVHTPLTGARKLLAEAGEELKRKTNDAIDFRVTPYRDDQDYPFTYAFELYLPKLDFPFLLFRVRTHQTGFPAVIDWGGGDRVKDIHDEAGLRAGLSAVFHADYTRKVVENLLSIATEPDPDADADLDAA